MGYDMVKPDTVFQIFRENQILHKDSSGFSYKKIVDEQINNCKRIYSKPYRLSDLIKIIDEVLL
jgi:hypothetical protein